MYFQLLKIILWPKSDKKPRIIDFLPGNVNVISGASKTGKSAIIPIIDYCLGADRCAIPVGVIREHCAWFGILVDTIEGQKLIARREPGDQQSTSDMLLLEGDKVDVPHQITERTHTTETVKNTLNRLAGLTNLGFEPDSESGFKSRPSFRDLMAFTFQPQNIVANPDVMFFKADTTEHREKLKTIFPYVLNAVDAKILQARYEIEKLTKALRRKEAELRTINAASTAWKLETQAWLRQAIEFGLLPSDQAIPELWADIIDILKGITKKNPLSARPSLAGMDVTLSRLQTLRQQETDVASDLSSHRERLNELRRLLESSQIYGNAMHVQRDRLALADWLRNLAKDKDEPLAAVGRGTEQLAMLCDTLDGIEIQLRTYPSVSDTLDKEMLRQRSEAEAVLDRLNEIRGEISNLESASDAAKDVMDKFHRVERFMGRLEQALDLYDKADQSADLQQEIANLKERIQELEKLVSEKNIHRKIQNALDTIQNTTSQLVPQLDAEWPEAAIRLMIADLTVKVIRDNRDDYLWSIGSGANWLAYHVALTLALQKYFISDVHHPVPGFLVYDQPSQVYFPKSLVRREEIEPEAEWKDQDVVAVRKVFALLGKEVLAAKGRLQIIVLDHADSEVWRDLPGIKLVQEWRGEALVPTDWQLITHQPL